jgi:hypothetical protein
MWRSFKRRIENIKNQFKKYKDITNKKLEKTQKQLRAGSIAQVVENLPNKLEALSSSPSTVKINK